MTEFQEVTDTIDVPQHAGVEGFIAAIRQVLKKPRVTQVIIDAHGKLTFTRFARPEEPRKHVEVDFETVSPASLVRNAEVQEIDLSRWDDNAAVCIAMMFHTASLEQMYPVGFVTGANTRLFDWHKQTTGVMLLNNTAYGLPVHRDRFISDDALLLVTAYARNAGLIDVQKSYKMTMPEHAAPHPVIELPQQVLPAGGDPFVLAEPPKAGEVKVVE
jgi:hypothetical protein